MGDLIGHGKPKNDMRFDSLGKPSLLVDGERPLLVDWGRNKTRGWPFWKRQNLSDCGIDVLFFATG